MDNPAETPARPEYQERAVAVLTAPCDAAAEWRVQEAVRREAWRVAAPWEGGVCAAVVWSRESQADDTLAARARSYLDRSTLLQILWQPKNWGYGSTSRVEAPKPFCYYQALSLPHSDLNGTERSVDWFGTLRPEFDKGLSELARLGGLQRAHETWNALLTFHNPGLIDLTRDTYLVEYAADGVRVLRRIELRQFSNMSLKLETTRGNHWCIFDTETWERLDHFVVEDQVHNAALPKRKAWWRRVFRD